MPWIAAALLMLMAVPAAPQGNIDAGKTPAQIFSDTCRACHRAPQEVRRASASFLRQHYTAGSAEASAMAKYLASVGPDPRKERAKAERIKAQQDRIKAQQERLKAQQERAKAATNGKTRRAEAPKVAPPPLPVPEEAPPEPAPVVEAAPKPPKPVLEPFEE